ncbi:MAG: antitoxin [Deltaproteobacteria bacterium]|nr:antitoxin [Deltaproteobacteria bacterium]
MRTTITLDSDVFQKLGQKIRQSRRPAKQVYNDLLRAALAEKRRPKKREAFHLPVFRGKKGLMPGFSWEMSTSQILDRLDEEEFRQKE